MCVRVNETVVFYRTCVTPVRSYLLAKSGRTSRRSRSRATAQARDRRGRSAPPTTRQRASSPRKPATSPVSHPSIDSFQSLTALPPLNALRLSYLARTYSCIPKFVRAYCFAVLFACVLSCGSLYMYAAIFYGRSISSHMTITICVCLLLQTRGAAAVASEVEVAAAAFGVEVAVDTIAVVATTVATSAHAAQCE